MSLRYRVYNAIVAGCQTCEAITERVGGTKKSNYNIISKLRCQGMIEGGPGAYRASAGAHVDDSDRRGKEPGSAQGRAKGVAAKTGNRPTHKPTACALLECWPEPKEEH